MGNWHSFRRRPPLSGSLGRQADATARACSCPRGVHFGGSALCRYMRAVSLILLFRPLRGLLGICERATAQLRSCVHFRGFLLCSYMEAGTSSPLRLPLRGRLRPSFRSSLRGLARPEARQRPSQRRLRAWRFADIPTPPPVQNIESVPAVVVALSIFSASLALDACAIATALAPHRSSTASATVIASALATTQRPIGFALAPQRFAASVASLGAGMSWKAAAGLRLPEATAEVIASLGEHRVLSTAQVRAIHFPDRSPRRAQQVLAYLERAGLVAYGEARRAPRRLWFLTERGADSVLDAGEVERRPKVLSPRASGWAAARPHPRRQRGRDQLPAHSAGAGRRIRAALLAARDRPSPQPWSRPRSPHADRRRGAELRARRGQALSSMSSASWRWTAPRSRLNAWSPSWPATASFVAPATNAASRCGAATTRPSLL